eukprot:7027719-Prymnesium_polylepis.1
MADLAGRGGSVRPSDDSAQGTASFLPPPPSKGPQRVMNNVQFVHHSPPLPVLVRRAIKTHDLAKLRYALDYDADLSEGDQHGRTPFHLAATSAVAMANETHVKGDSLAAVKMLMRFAELSGSEHTIEDLCGELDNNGLNALHILVQASHSLHDYHHSPNPLRCLQPTLSPVSAAQSQTVVHAGRPPRRRGAAA